jgi:excinuclease UvrABC ATPase subunit
MYVVDGAYLQGDSIAELSGEARNALRVVVPRLAVQSFSSKDSNIASESIRLTGVDTAGLVIPEVEFPLGTLSIVEGAPGTGKSLLLTEISRRFTKRKKMAHVASFGGIKRCHFFGPVSASTVSLLDLLCLDGDLAEEIARTRVAQQEGVTASDLSRASARYRCVACGGSGRLGIFSEHAEAQKQECDECGGVLYDWRVADMPLLGRTVAEVLRTPLSEVLQFLWRDAAVSFVLARVSSALEKSVTLATPCLDLTVEERGFVALAGRLARLVAPLKEKRVGRAGLTGELVLVDGPRTLTSCHLTIIVDLLNDLVGSGATVIYADLPPGLESDGAHVLRLRAADDGVTFGEKRTFADSRYARASVVG